MAVTFATFNLYQFAQPPAAWYNPSNQYQDDEWADKLQWLTNMLTDIDADVIGFQEVFSIDALAELVGKLGYNQFVTVDTPKVDQQHQGALYSPVVAIASKYPIKSYQSVAVQTDLQGLWPVAADFCFSRAPIRAQIELPGIGDTYVYVSHLKSKLPTKLAITNDSIGAADKLFHAAKQASLGQVASMVQRGVEATMLYQDVISIIEADHNSPIILMGDMNDIDTSVVFDALTNNSAHFDIDIDNDDDDDDELSALTSDQVKLFDSHHLVTRQNNLPRVATTYHGQQGNIFDYIFVSNALNTNNPKHLAYPSEYRVLNSHLNPDGSTDQTRSDHACVAMTLSLAGTP